MVLNKAPQNEKLYLENGYSKSKELELRKSTGPDFQQKGLRKLTV